MLTIREIAKDYGYSTWWLRKLVREGKFPSPKTPPGRRKRFAENDVAQWYLDYCKPDGLTVKEVSALTGYRGHRIQRHVRAGRFPQPIGRRWNAFVFDPKDIARFNKERR